MNLETWRPIEVGARYPRFVWRAPYLVVGVLAVLIFGAIFFAARKNRYGLHEAETISEKPNAPPPGAESQPVPGLTTKDGKPWKPPKVSADDVKFLNSLKPLDQEKRERRGKNADQDLLDAAADNDVEFAQNALSRGAHVDYLMGAPLQAAAQACASKTVAILLKAGASVQYGYPDQWPIVVASEHEKCLETVQLLIGAGEDVHAEDDAALIGASKYGNAETVKALLAAGADVHAQDDAALLAAVQRKHADVVDILLKAGANPRAGNDRIIKAGADGGDETIIRLLAASSLR